MHNADKPRWRRFATSRYAPNFDLLSAKSNSFVQLQDSKHQRLVLAFIPGVWAPWCRQYLAELNRDVPQMQKEGVKVIVIISQNHEQLANYVKQNRIKIEILSDVNGVIGKRYGVFDENNEEPMKISKPSIFVLNKDNRLLFSFIGRHLMDRPNMQELFNKATEVFPEDRPGLWERFTSIFRRPQYANT